MTTIGLGKSFNLRKLAERLNFFSGSGVSNSAIPEIVGDALDNSPEIVRELHDISHNINNVMFSLEAILPGQNIFGNSFIATRVPHAERFRQLSEFITAHTIYLRTNVDGPNQPDYLDKGQHKSDFLLARDPKESITKASEKSIHEDTSKIEAAAIIAIEHIEFVLENRKDREFGIVGLNDQDNIEMLYDAREKMQNSLQALQDIRETLGISAKDVFELNDLKEDMTPDI